jgi:hypothetical protein
MNNIFPTRTDLIKTLPKGMVIAELGVFLGEFSKELYQILEPEELFLVDIFSGDTGSGDKDGNNFQFINLDLSFDNLTKWSVGKNVHVIKNTTSVFLDLQKDSFLDMVYIDADHSYSAVLSDLEKSFRVVKDKGFICGHDYSADHFPEVVAAVDEFCTKYNLSIQALTQDGCPTYLIQK